MSSHSSEIKFSEWRPIGVCDQVHPIEKNQQKAVMFDEKDLAIVTSPHITRQNWKSQPDLIQLIHRYAKKVKKISEITKEMKQPVVADIKLVGMVLDFRETPDLNQESAEGKVQLFQIEFKDLGKKKSYFWKIILGILAFILLSLIIYYVLQQSLPQGGTASLCGTQRSSQVYASHLNQVRAAMESYLEKLPYNYKKSCYFSTRSSIESINTNEQQLIRCYLTLKRVETALYPSPTQLLKNTSQCLRRICEKNLSRGGLPHLQNYCQQLKF